MKQTEFTTKARKKRKHESVDGAKRHPIRENTKTEMIFEELSNKIINSALEVHKKLGPGFMESIYQTAMLIQLQKDGMKTEFQKEVKIYYDGKEIGIHRLDLVVNNEIILELKAVKEFDEIHFAQTLSYLKATGLKTALLLNFSKPKLDIKRIVN
jgi:GxxExxY protein